MSAARARAEAMARAAYGTESQWPPGYTIDPAAEETVAAAAALAAMLDAYFAHTRLIDRGWRVPLVCVFKPEPIDE